MKYNSLSSAYDGIAVLIIFFASREGCRYRIHLKMRSAKRRMREHVLNREGRLKREQQKPPALCFIVPPYLFVMKI